MTTTSLDALKAKLRERSHPEIDKLTRHEHTSSGVTFLIRPMNSDGYAAIEAAEVLPTEAASWPEVDRLKFLNAAQARAYFTHGLFLEDGTKPDSDAVELLLSGPWGADNRLMVNAIRKVNPPREQLHADISAVIAMSRMTVVLLRLSIAAGFAEKARDYLLADPESPENAALAEDLRKWEDTLPAWEEILESRAAARTFGIGVYEREEQRQAEQQPV